MNVFKTTQNYCGNNPEMLRRIAMAVIFSLNSSIIGLARRQMSLNRKDNHLFLDGTTPGDRFATDTIDANVRDLEMRRAKNGQGSHSADSVAEAGTADGVLEEQGFTVENPAALAEKFVAMRTLVLLETNELIKRHHLNPLQDQSITRQILWQLDLPYRENTAKITEAVAASQGRVSIEVVRKALHDDFLVMQKMRKDMAPELIVTAESFNCADIEDDDKDHLMTAERYYETHFDSLSKLRVLNAVWAKAQKFISTDIPSGKLPVMNMAHEIGVIAQMMGDLETEAKELLDNCLPEYIATYIDRGFAGLPVIVHIENAAKVKAQRSAQALLDMPSDLEAVLRRTAELRTARRALVKPATTPAPTETPAPPAAA